MPISQLELIEEFGAAAEFGNAAAFVGAGLSQGVGLPGWYELLSKPAIELDIPLGDDLPLVAEYMTQTGKLTDVQLAQRIRQELLKAPAAPGPAHKALGRIPLDQIWTTNYDTLIEQACPQSELIVSDDEVTRAGGTRRSVIKMHGSLSETGWSAMPVITRKHYETYRENHRRMWAMLNATYLSRVMLFLGFSFNDPNIDILLSLARTLETSVGDRHMTIMRRPNSENTPREKLDEASKLHALRVVDLESSGVRVHEIDAFEELEKVLSALVRRTRTRRLFVSGSFDSNDKTGLEACRALAVPLADRIGWTLVSLGGQAGWWVSQQLGQHRRAEQKYEARQFEFHFRDSDRPPKPLSERLGTALYHAKTREALVPTLLDECRAMIVVGGGSRTSEEIDWARKAGVPAIPLAYAGGAAKYYWETCAASPPAIGGQDTSPDLWKRLGNSNVDVAARAAAELLDRAMYSGTLSTIS